MKLKVVSPIKAYLIDATVEDMEVLRKALSYTNTANQHLMKRHYNNQWLRNKNKDAWEAKLEELKGTIHHTLIFDDDMGRFVRPGSIPYIMEVFPSLEVENTIKYPTMKTIAWAKMLPFQLHPYQANSLVNLINIKHGNVQLCTGAGKSVILLKVCRETGLKTAIIAPSRSIFNELLEKFEYHLGKGNVGAFGDGKKKLGKKFTICISDSLSNIKPDTPEWEFFSKLDMLCADESHTWGAQTLDAICHGVLADVPYRLFFSGTQTRGDGAEKLLQSIIGKTVYTLTTQEAVAGGYISPHDFAIVDVESSNPNYNVADPLGMKRIHFLGNTNIAAFIAKLANAASLASGSQSLVLVEELSQVSMLTKLLKVPFAYAHSESKKDRLLELGLEKVDPAESVEKFNKNEVKVLIGTSCIATGTNIYPMANTFNWVGGASEIKTKQGTVGRTVRLWTHNPWKDKCLPIAKKRIWDFNVHDVYVLVKHLDDRISYYEESGSEIKRIKLIKRVNS